MKTLGGRQPRRISPHTATACHLHQRHETREAREPPISGPNTDPIAAMDVPRPTCPVGGKSAISHIESLSSRLYLHALFDGFIPPVMMVKAPLYIPELPDPDIARAIISILEETDTAERREPSSKRNKKTRNVYYLWC